MPITALPVELMLALGSHLEHSSDLAALVRTCQAFHHILTPLLYQSVVLTMFSTVCRFCQTVIDDKSLRFANMIKSFHLDYYGEPLVTHDQWLESVALVNDVLDRLSHLERLDCYWKSSISVLESLLHRNSRTIKELRCVFYSNFSAAYQTETRNSVEILSGCRFPQLRALNIAADQPCPTFERMICHILESCSADLRSLRMQTISAEMAASVTEYLGRQQMSLEELYLDEYTPLTLDVIPQLTALKSIKIDHDNCPEYGDQNVATIGQHAAQHLPALESVTCPPELLPMFFPVPSTPLSVCQRRVSSVFQTSWSVPWDVLHGVFTKFVIPSRLAVHITHISLYVVTVHLDALASLLAHMERLETLRLAIAHDQVEDTSRKLSENMAAFGNSLLQVMHNLYTISIRKVVHPGRGFDYTPDFALQRRWLTQWDEYHPNNKLRSVRFTMETQWTKRSAVELTLKETNSDNWEATDRFSGQHID